jgi:hypothetical protein
MSGVVFVTGGTPTLALNDGGIATFAGGSGSDALYFNYTVAPGENTPDLAIIGVDLHGAVIRDGTGDDADIAGAVVNPAGTLQIDTIAPGAPVIALAHDTGFSFTDHITSDPTLAVTAAESGGTLLYKVDGAANFSSAVPNFATDGSADGFHTVLVEQMDAAGNIGPAASLSFTLEAVPYYGPPRWAGWAEGNSPGQGTTTDFTPPINTGGAPQPNHEDSRIYDRFVTAVLGESFKPVFDHFETAAVAPTPFLTLADFFPHSTILADFAGDLAHLDHVAASFGESFIHGADRPHSDYAFHL